MSMHTNFVPVSPWVCVERTGQGVVLFYNYNVLLMIYLFQSSFTEERRHNYVSICLPRKVLLHFWDFVQQTSDLKCFFTIFNNAQFCMSKQSTSGSSTQHEGSTIRWGLQLALTETCVLVHLRWTSHQNALYIWSEFKLASRVICNVKQSAVHHFFKIIL